MARLSFLEQHTLQPGGQGQAKPLCLRNPDYSKMRRKLELSFPEQLDAGKVQYTCIFSTCCTVVCIAVSFPTVNQIHILYMIFVHGRLCVWQLSAQ